MLETYRGGNQIVERSGIRIDVVSLIDLQDDINFILVGRNGGRRVDVICGVWYVEARGGTRVTRCYRRDFVVIRGKRGSGREWMKIGRHNGSGPGLRMLVQLSTEVSERTRGGRRVARVFGRRGEPQEEVDCGRRTRRIDVVFMVFHREQKIVLL